MRLFLFKFFISQFRNENKVVLTMDTLATVLGRRAISLLFELKFLLKIIMPMNYKQRSILVGSLHYPLILFNYASHHVAKKKNTFGVLSRV